MNFGFLRLFLGTALLLGILLLSGRPATAVAALQATNLLQNPNLDEPYINGVAQNWSPWHEGKNDNPKPAECSAPYTVLPKWSAELNSALIRSGGRSQHVGNQWDTWRGGVMQTVNVSPGATYRFSFWARGRASNDQYPAPSDGGVNLGVRAGVDPEGRGIWYQGVVWGAALSPHDNWQQATVEITAVADKVTVYTQADLGGTGNCRAHLDVWFDQAELVAAAPPPTNTPPPPPPPPPQPVATNTPLPATATATSEVPPTDTPVPADTPTATPEPPKGATICVNSFSDVNGDGLHDANEGFMAGVIFTVVANDQIVGQGISTGTDRPVCFQELAAGSYQVNQVVPGLLEMTTAADITIDVQEGQAVELKFGSRIRAQEVGVAQSGSADPAAGGAETEPSSVATPLPQAVTTAPATGGLSLTAISGLLLILLAVVLLGALIFMLLRQPVRG
jgi:hypothetical protein